jgi:hypothetical protein
MSSWRGNAPNTVHDAFSFPVPFFVWCAREVALPFAVHALGYHLQNEPHLITAVEEEYVAAIAVRRGEVLLDAVSELVIVDIIADNIVACCTYRGVLPMVL